MPYPSDFQTQKKRKKISTIRNTPHTCPHCGGEIALQSYVCGTTLPNIKREYSQSELCREREKFRKLEEELEAAKLQNEEYLAKLKEKELQEIGALPKPE